MEITFTLPWPPSVNSMWRTPHSGPLAGRTMLSSAGRAYRQLVAQHVMLQRVPRDLLTGKLGVFIAAHPPDRRARDIDNLNKAALDALQHAGVIESDSEIDDLHVVRASVLPAGQLKITVRELVAHG